MKKASNKIDNILLIGGIEISYDEILTREVNSFSINTYYQTTLAFIKDWLSGKETFTLQTSGSTGTPKTITVSREQMVYSAEATARALGLLEGYSALICLNTKYVAGIMMIVRSLVTGMKMTIVEPSSNPFENLSENHAFDFTALVPLQLEQIIDNLPVKASLLNRFKSIVVGGARVNDQLLAKIKQINAPIYATYGMTETLSHIALQKLNGPDATDYFKTLENVELSLDQRGCLTIKSPVTLNNSVITNDLVELIAADKFRFLGRYDNVINSGGVKIFPEKVESEVEKIFDQTKTDRRFFVAGTENERLGEEVTLFVEGLPFSESNLQVVKTLLVKQLSAYEMPRKIFFIEKFEETATGKIDRKASIRSSLS